MSLYHSFRKIGKKKEISDRTTIGSDSRILYAHTKTGMQKSIPVLMVRQAGIDRLTALRLQAASSPHTVRHRITRCQRLHRSRWPRSCPLGSDSRILYAHIKTGMQKKHPCFDGAPGGNRTRGLHIRSVLLYPLSYWRR